MTPTLSELISELRNRIDMIFFLNITSGCVLLGKNCPGRVTAVSLRKINDFKKSYEENSHLDESDKSDDEVLHEDSNLKKSELELHDSVIARETFLALLVLSSCDLVCGTAYNLNQTSKKLKLNERTLNAVMLIQH